jgi:probable phosphoglycerate mutase
VEANKIENILQESIGKMDLLDFFKRVSTNTDETTLLEPSVPYELTNYYFLKGSKATCKDPSLMQFDGASDPNPGPSCGAAVVYKTTRNTSDILAEGGLFLPLATNNVAEYTGLVYGLELAKKKGVKALLIEGDSQLVVLQMAKRWQVKDMRMRTHWEKAQDLLKDFDFVAIKHVYRDSNQKADALSKEGLRRRVHFERA